MMRPEQSIIATCRQATQASIARIGTLLNIDNIDLQSWYRDTFGVAIDSDPDLSLRGTPCGSDRISQIIRTASQARNEHLSKLIVSQLEKSRPIGIVYGAGHFSALAEQLTAYFGAAPKIIRPQ